jgi:L-aspartate oxidase
MVAQGGTRGRDKELNLQSMIRKFDFLVIGSGVAGMCYALKVARAGKGKVAIVCKTTLDEANTAKAQGGIASVTDFKVDNYEKHIHDTMVAGDFISDPAAVEQVVKCAPQGIKELVQWGVNFDKKDNGDYDLHREGGHSEFRILHHADDTGFEIQRGLMAAVRAEKNITILENHFAVEIITQHHLGVEVTRRTKDITCYGAYILDPDTQKIDTFLSRVTLLATGGTGAVYATTTNPNIATGDGIAMAYRAKATVQGMEFVQFHPTALYHPGETHPAYLITEAMRGYGGILRLPNGEEFMQKYDKRLSLAPRDIVARAIDKEMKIHGIDHVCLDVTHKNAEETKHGYPNIYAKCLSIGIDITKEYIPVVPCAHYMCGGVKVDLDGCSSIQRLYAVGECSCTGLHGGNRLASNSLIEAVVYADKAAKHSIANIDKYTFNESVPEWNDDGTMTNEEKVLIAQDKKEVGQIMSNYVGIVRSDLRLKRAWTRLDLLYEETEELFKRVKATKDICELRNMINVGYLITRQAIERKESRGLHYTLDYPKHAYDQK